VASSKVTACRATDEAAFVGENKPQLPQIKSFEKNGSGYCYRRKPPQELEVYLPPHLSRNFHEDDRDRPSQALPAPRGFVIQADRFLDAICFFASVMYLSALLHGCWHLHEKFPKRISFQSAPNVAV
jgi:hypothetical protein